MALHSMLGGASTDVKPPPASPAAGSGGDTRTRPDIRPRTRHTAATGWRLTQLKLGTCQNTLRHSLLVEKGVNWHPFMSPLACVEGQGER